MRCHRNEQSLATQDGAPMGKGGLIRSTVLVVLLAITVAVGSGNGLAASTWAQSEAPDLFDADPILVAVGDIGYCSSDGDEATAALLDGLPGTIATLGDNAYRSGTAAGVRRLLRPDLGPAQGPHAPSGRQPRLRNSRSGRLLRLFRGGGRRAAAKGYYSYDLGAWHIVVLNSNCSSGRRLWRRHPTGQWLRDGPGCPPGDLHPRLLAPSPVQLGDGARWERVDATGLASALRCRGGRGARRPRAQLRAVRAPGCHRPARPDRGIRQFVVGTGGKSLYEFGEALPASEVRNADAMGVLMLRLYATGYEWEFVPIARALFEDTGTWPCH